MVLKLLHVFYHEKRQASHFTGAFLPFHFFVLLHKDNSVSKLLYSNILYWKKTTISTWLLSVAIFWVFLYQGSERTKGMAESYFIRLAQHEYMP